jgi:MFS-type transporter involved in bile tolerance (Atg22 family)
VTVQGGTQAVSRSRTRTWYRTSVLLGFFFDSSKFVGVLGPFVFGVFTQETDTSRTGIVAFAVFFIGAIVSFGQVDVKTGR